MLDTGLILDAAITAHKNALTAYEATGFCGYPKNAQAGSAAAIAWQAVLDCREAVRDAHNAHFEIAEMK